MTGLLPGSAGIGPVKPTFSTGAGTSGVNPSAEPSSAYGVSQSQYCSMKKKLMGCKIIQLQNKSGETIHQTHRNMLEQKKELRETYINRAGRGISALWTSASKGCLYECILILPAINKVTVQPIACRVTHSIDPFVKIGEW